MWHAGTSSIDGDDQSRGRGRGSLARHGLPGDERPVHGGAGSGRPRAGRCPGPRLRPQPGRPEPRARPDRHHRADRAGPVEPDVPGHPAQPEPGSRRGRASTADRRVERARRGRGDPGRRGPPALRRHRARRAPAADRGSRAARAPTRAAGPDQPQTPRQRRSLPVGRPRRRHQSTWSPTCSHSGTARSSIWPVQPSRCRTASV